MIDLDGIPLEEEEEEEEEDEEFDGDESTEEEADEDDGSETEASGDDEWGFGEKKSRFSKEVLVGVAAVAVLCGVFGVVVWQNLGKNADDEEVATSPEGELGKEGKSDPKDPFTAGNGEVRTAAHIEVGEGSKNNAEENPFIAAGTGDEMGTFHEGEFGEGIGELQGEPAIEEGINTADTGMRLDPFGQPLNSNSTGIGETGIGETGIREVGISETGTDIGETTLGSTGIGETGIGDGTLGSTTASPGTGTTFEPEQPTGLFEPRNEGVGTGDDTLTETTIGESPGPETGGEINPLETRPDPFGREETKPRVDEFGRPIDEFGRPVETASSGVSGIGETTQPLLDTTGTGIGSTEIGSPGVGGGLPTLGENSIGITETSTGIGETTTGIGESSLSPGEGTTELFPSDTAGSTTRISEKPTGLFEPQPTTDGGLESSTPGIGETTETPGFESNLGIGSSETETFFPPETTSTAGTGTLPSESAFPSSTGTGSLPDTGTFEPGVGSETGTSQPGFDTEGAGSLPVIGSPGTNPFDSTGSTTIVGGYPIQPGDSYWTISKKLYGTARYFRVLAEYNSKAIPDPSKMRPGMTISTPDEAVLRRMLLANSSTSAGSAEAQRPAGAPPITPAQGIFFDEKNQPRYRVGKDDTLTTIAAEHLGRWARWRQIFEMNKDQMDNPNKLQIGMVLKLPADATRTSMSRRDNRIR